MVLLSFFLARSISDPLRLVLAGADRLAVGDPDMKGLDYDRTLEVSARGDELGAVGRSLGRLEDYFREKAAAANAIARGDLAIDVPVASEEDVLGQAMVRMKESISAMTESVNGLIRAAVAGELDTRADASEFEGEYREIVDGVNQTLDAVIGPLNVAAEYVDRISKGDIPAKITDDYSGDFNEIKNNLNLCIDALNGLTADMDRMYHEQRAGDIDTKIDVDCFVGVYREVAEGYNEAVHLHVRHILRILDIIGQYAEGDFSEQLEELPGKQKVANERMDLLRDNLLGLIDEMDMLTKAAVKGKWDTRGDASNFGGGYREVVRGVNDTLDAVIGPLNMAAEYVDRISKGDIPEKITDEYYGDFNDIKDNLNLCIDAIGSLAGEMDALTKAAVEGRLEARGDASKFSGDYAALIRGVNAVIDSLVGLLAAMPSALVIVDADLVVRYLNEAALQAIGCSREAALGQKSYELFETDQRDSALRRAIVETDYVTAEIHNRVNGQVHHYAHVAMPMMDMDGNTIGGIGVFEDQTEVRESARRTEKIAEFQEQEVEKLQRSLKALAAGNLRQAYEVGEADEDTAETREAFAAIAEAFNESVVGLRSMASQMQEGAMNITSATSEILASSSQMASTTKEQASAVTEVTSTVEEIQSSAEQVAQRAQGVAEAAEQASRAARDGSMAADEAIAAMSDIRQRVDAIAENILSLSEQTQQIGEIIDTVTDIADQSNILALNAAIEAAQAGEAGKGFRVVADEVRSLAEQSRQAAAQVKVILGDIQEASNRAVMATEQGTKQVATGSDQVERTAQTIRELTSTVEQSSQASEQIVAGVQQQTVGLDQIAVGMTDINQAAQQAAAGAEQSEKAAQDLDTLGARLEQTVEQYEM